MIFWQCNFVALFLNKDIDAIFCVITVNDIGKLPIKVSVPNFLARGFVNFPVTS